MDIEREQPGPGQESVWDYPRPPLVQPTSKHIEVVFAGEVIADTTRGLRGLETGNAPVYYVPLADVRADVLEPMGRSSYSDFMGESSYYRVRVGGLSADDAAWTYTEPKPGYELLVGYVGFYPALMDECRVDGEIALPQPGNFYRGWVTPDIVGPFRGMPGIGFR